MLMLVLIMMNEARKPSNWNWLWDSETSTTSTHEVQPIETRLDDTNRELPVDGFTAEAPGVNEQMELDGDYLPEITAELLHPIKDNTVLRAAENEAWLTMLEVLQSRSADAIEALSTGDVGFAQLFRQTDVYRGRLVTVHGTVRGLEEITPRENEQGINQLFRWVLRPDGNNSPMIIYSLQKPDELTVGNDLRERCSFTGFCFKRWAYAAADGTRVAPLLLAKAPKWSTTTRPSDTPLPSRNTLFLFAIAVLVVSIAIALMVNHAASAKRPEIERLRKSQGNLDANLAGESILPNTNAALEEMEQTS